MRDLIKLTDEAIYEALAEAGAGVSIIGEPDFECDGISFTRETPADFLAARDSWATPGYVALNDGQSLHIEGAQAVKGQPRKDITIVNFGEVSALYIG